MNSSTSRSTPFKVVKIIWTALLFSQFMYAFLLFGVLSSQWDNAETRFFPDFHDTFELVICAVAVVVAVISVKLPPFLARSMKSGSSNTSLAEAAEEPTEETVTREHFAAFVVGLALMESICLYGFALAMTKHAAGLILPFMAVSVLLFLKNFPSNSKKFRSDLGL